MHGPSLAILVVVATFGLASSSPAGTDEALADARRKLAREDGIAAVSILETALPEAGPGKDKEAVLDLLRKAYQVATNQALGAGRAEEAETYRENLKILNRKPRQARPAPSTPSRAKIETPSSPTPISEPAARPIDPSAGGPTPLPEGPIPPVAAEADAGLVAATSPTETSPLQAEPSPASPTIEPPDLPAPGASAPPATDLATADAAFVAKDYPAAGRIYGTLAREQRLPPERRDQWLYCRESVIKDRINARPNTDSEWAEIKAEVADIQAVNPSNMLAEYLRNLVNERYTSWKKRKPAKAMVVRGSAPEEPTAKAKPARPSSNPAPPDASAKSATLASASSTALAGPAARVGTASGRWQVADSTNFRIYHADPALAAKVATAAETARRELLKRWAGNVSRPSWQPPCEIYLYPSAKQYAQMTGQPEDSPGFSTMGMNAGRIISRRINLRTDHAGLVQAVLPHELTHVILADHFTERQIPRWADEGLAVLSEPADEQQRRANDLARPLVDNRLFAVDALMNMDYPDERYWGLYYAQCVSLSRFLVEQGTAGQMIQFLQDSQREGYEPALRRLYKIDGFADLQRRWLAYARSKSEGPGMAAAPATGPELKIR